jgi:UPF0755 protein
MLMKKTRIILFVIAGAAASLLFLPLFSGADSLVEIREGTAGKKAAAGIAAALRPEFPPVFTASYAITSLMYGPAKPGCYRFSWTSAFKATRSLCRGDLEKVIITEGMTSSDISKAMASALGITPDKEKLLHSSLTPFEGELFPAVYPIRSLKPEDLCSAMRKKYSSAAGIRFTRNECIEASIVQKEAKYRKDFRRCAGVLRNRLKQNMNLELDSVYQYIVGPNRITKELIASDSPYNTFRRKGLPPTPICSPGIAALEAAKDPEEHDYFYFVAKKNGELYFSKDRHEHYRAVEFFVLGRPNGFKPKPQ